MIRRLSHVCFLTNDLERQTAFYRDLLGLTVQFRFVNAAGDEFGVYLGCGDTTFIEIFDQVLAAQQWGGEVKPLQAGSRYAHYCFEVTGLADLHVTLSGRGIDVGPISQGMDFSHQAWLTDPDGNRIELMEFTHRSRQLQAPEG